jgi:hypothetical protein
MPLRYTFTNKTTRVEHERGRYVCPLRLPEATADTCPVAHKQCPRVAARPPSPPASAHACVTNATAIARPTKTSTNNAPQPNAHLHLRCGAAASAGVNGQAVAYLNTLIYITRL